MKTRREIKTRRETKTQRETKTRRETETRRKRKRRASPCAGVWRRFAAWGALKGRQITAAGVSPPLGKSEVDERRSPLSFSALLYASSHSLATAVYNL